MQQNQITYYICHELTAESEDLEVTVTYSPNMIESTETKEVKQTIHYVYEDGKQAASDKTDTVTFTNPNA